MTYRTFNILAILDGTPKFFEILAVDLQAALADIRAAYGEATVIQYSVK